ncbi:MAG: type II toxin-antitoxin system HicA family toxin [Hyphomicrobiaceae bacterium]|nr:addiction module toxin, HicA family [Hyphomicrobiaceae bacterium]
MTSRVPALKGDEVVRALRKAGFEVTRVRGSHHILCDPRNPARRTVVPVHAGKDVKRGLLRKIIDDAGLSVEEFVKLL